MLVSAAFMQSMAAFTAQNKGAGRMDRAIKGLQCAMGLSCGCGLIMGFFTFFTATSWPACLPLPHPLWQRRQTT